MALLAVGGAIALDVLPAVELGHEAIIAGGRSRLGGWSRGVATTEGKRRSAGSLLWKGTGVEAAACSRRYLAQNRR
jgi:hypothetical protein